MRADIISTSDLMPRDLEAWRQLADQSVSPNPYADPDFALAATRSLGVTDLGVLFVRDSAEWLAAVPVRRLNAWRGVPGRCLAAWRYTAYCYLGTPLVSSQNAETALAALITRGLRDYGCLALDWIDADGPLAEVLTSVLAEKSRHAVIEEFERAALYRQPNNDYLNQAVSARHRKELRRTFRLLAGEVGDLTVVDRSGDRAAYEQFLELERSGWKGCAGTAIACRPGHDAFFVELCERFSRGGRLQLLSLGNEARTVAMKCNLIAGDVTFCFKIAFDEGLARFSPGMHLEVANIGCFHDGQSQWSDSCAGPNNAMINRLWSGRRRLRSVVATPPGVAGALLYAKWRAAIAARPMRDKIMRRFRSGASGH